MGHRAKRLRAAVFPVRVREAQALLSRVQHQGTILGDGRALPGLVEWNVPDPLWFDVDNPRFGILGEVNRIIRAGFVEVLVGLVFPKSFWHSGHPFYDAVYAEAATINELYTDSMDTYYQMKTRVCDLCGRK